MSVYGQASWCNAETVESEHESLASAESKPAEATHAAHVKSRAWLFLVVGTGLGACADWLWKGQLVLAIGCGIFAGALAGAYRDGQSRKRFLVVVVALALGALFSLYGTFT